jgi:hypothetical protein
MIRLAGLVERYGEAIAADLALAGWDAVDLFERGRWAFMLNLIDHLPRTSAYAQAIADDDELVESMPEPPASSGSVPLREWSPEVEALAVVVDRLAEVANTLVAAHGGKPSRVQAYPRPVTAFDRVRAKRRREAADDLARKLFPDG